MLQTLEAVGDVSLEELKEFVQENRIVKMYTKFVGVGWRHCEYDLCVMVTDALDYFCEKYFREDYENLFGVLVPLPFSNPDANGCRYILLANFVSRGTFSSQVQQIAAQNLLLRTESALLHAVSAHENGLVETTDFSIRYDVAQFSTCSHLREGRTFGAHIFSSMLQQWNEDFNAELPPVKPLAFNFGRPQMLKSMALRALVLSDLKSRFHNNALVEPCGFLHSIGFLLAQKIMNSHAPFSFKVSYSSLSAIIVKNGESTEDISIDHIFELRGATEVGVEGANLISETTLL